MELGYTVVPPAISTELRTPVRETGTETEDWESGPGRERSPRTGFGDRHRAGWNPLKGEQVRKKCLAYTKEGRNQQARPGRLKHYTGLQLLKIRG